MTKIVGSGKFRVIVFESAAYLQSGKNSTAIIRAILVDIN